MNELSWKITPSEKRERFQLGILVVGPMLVMFFAGYMINNFVIPGEMEIREFLYILGIMMASLPILFLINKLLSYKERTYFLSNNKIAISRGNKKKEYSWDEFEDFYSSLKVKRSVAPKILSESKVLMGDTYYLKKRQESFLSKLSQTFVIIYSEPENDKEVLKLLFSHLPIREKKIRDDLGLIFYEFK